MRIKIKKEKSHESAQEFMNNSNEARARALFEPTRQDHEPAQLIYAPIPCAPVQFGFNLK